MSVHSNLPNIMTVATDLHVVLRRSTVFTWMCNNRELVQHVTLWNSMKFNIVIKDNMTHANVYFQIFGELFEC